MKVIGYVDMGQAKNQRWPGAINYIVYFDDGGQFTLCTDHSIWSALRWVPKLMEQGINNYVALG